MEKRYWFLHESKYIHTLTYSQIYLDQSREDLSELPPLLEKYGKRLFLCVSEDLLWRTLTGAPKEGGSVSVCRLSKRVPNAINSAVIDWTLPVRTTLRNHQTARSRHQQYRSGKSHQSRSEISFQSNWQFSKSRSDQKIPGCGSG